jgi:hypothetical protein
MPFEQLTLDPEARAGGCWALTVLPGVDGGDLAPNFMWHGFKPRCVGLCDPGRFSVSVHPPSRFKEFTNADFNDGIGVVWASENTGNMLEILLAFETDAADCGFAEAASLKSVALFPRKL